MPGAAGGAALQARAQAGGWFRGSQYSSHSTNQAARSPIWLLLAKHMVPPSLLTENSSTQHKETLKSEKQDPGGWVLYLRLSQWPLFVFRDVSCLSFFAPFPTWMQPNLGLVLKAWSRAALEGRWLELSISWAPLVSSLQGSRDLLFVLRFTWEALYAHYLKMESAKQTQPASKCCEGFFFSSLT